MPQSRLLGLLRKITTKKAVVGVLGAGYVGLPLACAFAKAGYKTVAADNDPKKVLAIRRGRPYVEDDYVRRYLSELTRSKRLESDDNISRVASVSDAAIIAVPTPLDANRQPDLSYVTSAMAAIAENIQPGKLIVLESSVYPGTTDLIVKPILERTGLCAGKDFALAHSPERIDYNNRKYGILNIPKVIGGVTPLCTRIAASLYEKILRAPVISVSSAAAAEATKMLENTYRYVNIALVNELSTLFERIGLDTFEVISAASSKPFGFQPFYPGPGVGGHCIPKDPHYLRYRAEQVGVCLRLVELSAQINDGMVDNLIARLEQFLENRGKTLRGSIAAILGLAFKADVSDWRRSPSIALAEKLNGLGVEIRVFDPFIRTVTSKMGQLTSTNDLEQAVCNADMLFLATPHSFFRKIKPRSLAKIMDSDAVIVDTRGFWARAEWERAGLNYVGLGRP
jgi:UDP-N-acetyl-D-glucosamine dehydrogenase